MGKGVWSEEPAVARAMAGSSSAKLRRGGFELRVVLVDADHVKGK
jgi:hypothetical protein